LVVVRVARTRLWGVRFQVVDGGFEVLRVFVEQADARVAARAKQAANLSGGVVVIDG
jgi:hypothetical protein